jgi:hypothetical protein
MKAPSIDDLKLAVARMIPDSIAVVRLQNPDAVKFWWVKNQSMTTAVTDHEWYAVCHLAEKTLPVGGWDAMEYSKWLWRLIGKERPVTIEHDSAWHATAEMKIEALCRVKFPEMFPLAGPSNAGNPSP